MNSLKKDPLLRSPEQRAAISGSWACHLSARRSHLTTCRCTLCSFGGCSTETPCIHCRASGAREEKVVSLDAIAAKYPQVAEVRTVNNDVADRLMTEFEKRAGLMPELAETFDWMRTLAGALRKVVS